MHAKSRHPRRLCSTTQKALKSKKNNNNSSKHDYNDLNIRNASVKVVDIFDENRKLIIALNSTVDTLKAKIEKLEEQITKFKHDINILNIPHNLNEVINKDILDSQQRFITSITTEVSQRIYRSNNVILLNIPDSIPLNTVRNTLLTAASLPNTPCQLLRLKKINLNMTAPSCCNLMNPIWPADLLLYDHISVIVHHTKS